MQTIYLGNYINLRTQLDVSSTVIIIRVLITTFKTFKVYVQRKWSHFFPLYRMEQIRELEAMISRVEDRMNR